MRIAVDTRLLLKGDERQRNIFIFECLKKIAAQYPNDDFIFIFDGPFDPSFIFSKNITPVVAGPRATRPILWQFWYNYKIPGILKKYKADVFVAASGICSLRTKVPQCLLLQDIDFLYAPQSLAKNQVSFYKKFVPEFLNKAISIITVSEFSKQDMIARYKIPADKIDVVYSGVNKMYTPIGEEEKERIKEKYAAGKEYFLYAGEMGPDKNLVTLLKAFSFFKKRQKSNMQLLIAGKTDGTEEPFIKALETYKYKPEVKLLPDLPEEELTKIMAAAYAFAYPSLFDNFPKAPIESMQCAVPVIAGNTGAMVEICGNAALYADPNKFEDLADKMMLLFKDENKRNELIIKGNLQAQQYSWEKTADLLWRSILKTTQL